MTHFEVDEVSLEQIFIDHVGRPADEDEHLAPEAAGGRRCDRCHPADRGPRRGGCMIERGPLGPP